MFELIVCGGGHAGCEAALIAARRGVKTLLLTQNLDTIASMNCNPAIGGLAKGNIVREIDALGGEMALNADRTAIHFRLLNRSKGLAVQGPRVQCDKKIYALRMKWILEKTPNLQIFQAEVVDLKVKNDRVIGVKIHREVFIHAKVVILTTGTYLNGRLFIGRTILPGGKMTDFASVGLSSALQRLGIEMGRLKTGTPPRILGSSIDFKKCQPQESDPDFVPFAFYDTRNASLEPKSNASGKGQCTGACVTSKETQCCHKLGWAPGTYEACCWLTSTQPRTAELVKHNLKKSALYGGQIVGTGPRYCPSIEDKFIRFIDKDSHRIFLEPEGIFSEEWYINGLSMSLPLELQEEIVQSVQGLEQAKLMRPAYAVEYDFAYPTQLLPSLESKKIENLFFAGQINGTSGYEEAAGQGIVAGINAVAKLREEPAFILSRAEAYIGVLIDDLVTKGTEEPYRMFTSRAEFRLLLNHSSAELRLFDKLKSLKLLLPERLKKIEEKQEQVQFFKEKLEQEGLGHRLRQGVDPKEIEFPQAFYLIHKIIQEEVIYQLTFQGYIQKDLQAVEQMDSLENIKITKEFDFAKVKGLRNETYQKLQKFSPENLGQASRISGITPTDIGILKVALRFSDKGCFEKSKWY